MIKSYEYVVQRLESFDHTHTDYIHVLSIHT